MTTYVAKGSSGGHSSFHSSSHSSVSHSSSSSKATPKSSTSKTTTKKTTSKNSTTKKSTAKPVVKKTATTGAKGKAATTKPKQTTLNGHKLSSGQTVTHQHFHNYSAPAGSVVYYRENSALDYLPWIYLFSQNNSPNNQQAIVVQPDGKQVSTRQDGDTNAMIVFNWILLILIVAVVIFCVIWGVNKLTNKKAKE